MKDVNAQGVSVVRMLSKCCKYDWRLLVGIKHSVINVGLPLVAGGQHSTKLSAGQNFLRFVNYTDN